MSIKNDALEKLNSEVAERTKAVNIQLKSPAIEAAMALDHRFAEVVAKAAPTLSLSREFEEMQQKFKSITESGLMKAMREIESPILAVVKAQQLWPTRLAAQALGSFGRSDFEDQLIKMKSTIAGDYMKKVRAMESIGGDFLKHVSRMSSLAGSDFSAKFLDANNAAASVWNTSAIKLAQTLADSFPKFDERIAEAMREFCALGSLQAEAATVSGIGAISESVETVKALGSPDNRQARPTALELWWAKQPIQITAFFLLLFFIIKSVTDAYIAEQVKAWTGAHGPQERQLIYNEITQNFGTDTARRLRCVRASALKVRSEASTTGKIVETLPRRTAVEVIESQASWSLIRYRVPHSSEIREGWAASGYLSLEVC